MHLRCITSAFLIVITLSVLLKGCSSSGGDGVNNIGWVNITGPTSEEVYELHYYQQVLEVSGEAFPLEPTITYTCACPDPTQLTCILFGIWECNEHVVHNYASISIFNITMDEVGSVEQHGESWRGLVPITLGENIIQVEAEDFSGNHGVDTLKVISQYSATGIPIWIKEFDEGSITALGVDQNGSAYVTLDYYGLNLEKYDALGNLQWSKHYDSVTTDFGNDIAVDINGNIYVTGSTYDGESDVFIAKYDTSGNQLWKKQFGTNAYEVSHNIAVDVNGNAYIAGYSRGDIDADGIHNDSDKGFFAKFDTFGNMVWIKQPASGNDRGFYIAVDINGDCYITGDTYSDLAGTGNVGGPDIFIAKYDTSGNQVWIQQFGTATVENSGGIAVDTEGNSYVAGTTGGDFDNISAVYAGDIDIFVAKLDASGNRLWLKQLGTTEQEGIGGVDVDAYGNSYVTGYTAGELASTISATSSDIFFAKYDTLGNQSTLKRLFIDRSQGQNIMVDSNGNSFVEGIRSTSKKYYSFLARLSQ